MQQLFFYYFFYHVWKFFPENLLFELFNFYFLRENFKQFYWFSTVVTKFTSGPMKREILFMKFQSFSPAWAFYVGILNLFDFSVHRFSTREGNFLWIS